MKKAAEVQMERPNYSTWYEFKKELQKEAGRSLLNADWLGVKPAEPLPWSKAHLRVALVRLRQPSKTRLLAARTGGLN